MRPPRRVALALTLALLAPLAAVIAATPPATAATTAIAAPRSGTIINVPKCDADVVYRQDYPNCELDQVGASMNLDPPTDQGSGVMGGTFSMTIPTPSAACGCDADSESAGIADRLYVPGGVQATYDNKGLNFQANIDQDVGSLRYGGQFTGHYSYHDPGGAPGVMLVTAYMAGSKSQTTDFGSVASDAEIQFGTETAPPNCVPPAPTISKATTGTVTVGVKPCAVPDTVSGYTLAAYVGTSTTPYASYAYSAAGTVAATGLPNGQPVSFKAAATNSSGSGAYSAASTKAVPPFVSATAFTTQMFKDLAGRSPTAAELSTWTQAINSGSKAPIAEAVSLLTSAASTRTAEVTRLFQAYFLRLPDGGGLTFWVGKLATGTSLNTVSSNFAASAEFKARYGSVSNATFVNLVYENVLGRAGDPGGVTYWTGQLNAKKATRGQVMTGFSESAEYKGKMAATVAVVQAYSEMLLRVPTAAEVSANPTSTAAITAVLNDSRYGLRVNSGGAPVITTSALPIGSKGVAYSATLTAAGGTAPLHWTVSPALPAGLVLNSSTGVISGKTTGPVNASFTFTVTDHANRKNTEALTLMISAAA
ncbi:MAG TPA: DUF4214 domain-containing protein [Acidimicrobiales bacterium]